MTVLHSFARSNEDGGNPYETVVQANDGNFYGTTWDGGSFDHGTVFQVTANGEYRTIYRFCVLENDVCPDGYNPQGSLIQGADGFLYGTTTRGGGSPCNFDNHGGCGTVFKISTSGELTTLHLFQGTDGASPTAALVQGTDGNFYGITTSDTISSCTNGCGTVYSMTPSGEVTTLYNFCQLSGCPDGYFPASGLVQHTNGTFYGTTTFGGNDNDGVLYSIDTGLAPFVKTNPSIGVVGHPVKIIGTDLSSATSVSFNGVAAAFTVVSATEIRTTVPAGATSGTVQVVTPGGTLNSNAQFWVRD